MAIATAYGSVTAAAITKLPVYRSAWWKANWSDAWTFIPYLDPQWAHESAAPEVGSARLRYDYGLIMREGSNTAQGFYPIDISGGYLAIRVDDYYSSALLWVGVADKESHAPHGTVAWFQGPQYFDAFALEHLFDRVQVDGTYTEFGYIDRAVRFNRADGRGMVTRGNRSASVAANGAYTFGDGGAKWTSLQIINYLIANYGPGGLTVQVVGDYAVLDTITEEWNFQGKNVFAAINELIDKHRGVSWRLLTTGSGVIYLYVFSTLAYPVSTGAAVMPANSNQVIINFDGLLDVQPTISLNRLDTYDAVMVRGGPISTCFSLSFADGTLEGAWTAAQATAYNTGSTAVGATGTEHDAERSTEKLANVFQTFRVPYVWDGYAGDGIGGTKYNAAPGYDKNAYVDPTVLAALWFAGKTFERELPISAPVDADANPEFVRSFAVAEDPITGDYHFVEKFRVADITPSHVRLSDQGMMIHVLSDIGHIQALNTFDDGTYDTDKPPEWDYNTMIVTVCLKTDAHPTVRMSLGAGLETGRTKVIEYPSAEYWLILPGTVYDVQNGALLHQSTWGVQRDDTPALRAIAAMAAASYLVPHAELGFALDGVSIAYPSGYLVRGMASNWTLTDVNAPVTSRRWDFTGEIPTTTWETHWAEFDATFASAPSSASLSGSGSRRSGNRYQDQRNAAYANAQAYRNSGARDAQAQRNASHDNASAQRNRMAGNYGEPQQPRWANSVDKNSASNAAPAKVTGPQRPKRPEYAANMDPAQADAIFGKEA